MQTNNESIPSLIDSHHEKQNAKQNLRPHLGASLLGHHCARYIWLSFRWAVREKLTGRILRLFRRGQLEEHQIVKDLRNIGMDVRVLSAQHKINFGTHISGSVDAIIEAGVPNAKNETHVAEFKTHNKKSFEILVKEGLRKSKFQHFVQMQIYMHGLKINKSLYVAVCKDDDRLYTDTVQYDKDFAEKYINRGNDISCSSTIPKKVSEDPTFYLCKMCSMHEFCHKTKMTKEINCRTCAFSVAKENGTWDCKRHSSENIPEEFQRTGCNSHVLHPHLTPWTYEQSSKDWQINYIIDGNVVKNGEADDNVYSSNEIVANPSACYSNNNDVAMLRNKFDAKIIA